MNIKMNSKKKKSLEISTTPVNNNLRKNFKNVTDITAENNISDGELKKSKKKKITATNENNLEVQVKERKKRKTEANEEVPAAKRARRKPKIAAESDHDVETIASLSTDDSERNEALSEAMFKKKRKSKTLAQQALAQHQINADIMELELFSEQPESFDAFKKETTFRKRVKKKEQSAMLVGVTEKKNAPEVLEQRKAPLDVAPNKKESAVRRRVKKKNLPAEVPNIIEEISQTPPLVQEELCDRNEATIEKKRQKTKKKEQMSEIPIIAEEITHTPPLEKKSVDQVESVIEKKEIVAKGRFRKKEPITDSANSFSQIPLVVKKCLDQTQEKEVYAKKGDKKIGEIDMAHENIQTPLIPVQLEESQPHIEHLVAQSNNDMDEILENNVIQIPDGPVSARVHITLQDLDDSDSDINENEIFGVPVVKVQENVKKKNSDGPKKVRPVITWSEEDLKELVDRMEAAIPTNDCLAYSTRADKLEWDMIAFKNYSVEDCKNTWLLLQKRIRKFRLLKEVLNDAKKWICNSKSSKSTKKKPKPIIKKPGRHPDMPRKPLSAYFLYYVMKKDSILSVNPGMDATEISKHLALEFKSLPPETRSEYEKLAVQKKQEYEQQLCEFYLRHPDISRPIKPLKVRRKQTPKVRPEKPPKPPKPPKSPRPVKEKPPPKPLKERIPKRPPPPFQFFYMDEMQKENPEDKLAFKEICKERWKQSSDKNKVIWITHAESEYAKYEEELKKYVESHPDYAHNPHKPILTKEETQIKDRVAGKPSKPPGSAYNLFARYLLGGEEIKNIPVRDRLIYVSNQWKNCAEEEKKQYRDLASRLNEKYKLDFASYLETLPEEERKLELQKTQRSLSKPGRPKSLDIDRKKSPSKKRKTERKTTKKMAEPEQPPISPFKYFAMLYTGENPAQQAWKALSPEQKKIYEDELVKKKQAYIVDFEKFLKSLTKEELEAFSNSRRKIKKESEEEDDEETSDDESDSEDSGDEDSTEGEAADENLVK